MDIRLKERLIGASVLVLAAVLFIPMVLDGPGANRRISQAVPLPQSGERRTVQIDLDSGEAATKHETARPSIDEPVSVDLVPAQEKESSQADVRSAEADAAASQAVPSGEPEVTASRPQTAAAAPPDAPWTVQAGSFSQQDNAESLAARLRELGFPAYVSRYDDGSSLHYRVRVGGFDSRAAAQEKADEINGETGEPARPTPAS